MTKLDKDNFLCTWCISSVPISVFSRGDNIAISGMKITCTVYSRVNKITQLYHVLMQRLLCFRTLGLDKCAVQKAGFSCF